MRELGCLTFPSRTNDGMTSLSGPTLHQHVGTVRDIRNRTPSLRVLHRCGTIIVVVPTQTAPVAGTSWRTPLLTAGWRCNASGSYTGEAVNASLQEGHLRVVIPENDSPKEACGVFGVYAPGEDVARLTFYGLCALQHRGQESAGIATSNGKDFSVRTGRSLLPGLD